MARRSLCESEIQDALLQDSSTDEDSDSPHDWHTYGEHSGVEEMSDEEGGGGGFRRHSTTTSTGPLTAAAMITRSHHPKAPPQHQAEWREEGSLT